MFHICFTSDACDTNAADMLQLFEGMPAVVLENLLHH